MPFIDRLDPATGVSLAEGDEPVKVRAFDATFSTSKSVSLVQALADPKRRAWSGSPTC
jgi:hypothetical protein